MGGVLSRAGTRLTGGANIELPGNYQRFGAQEGDVAWTLGLRGEDYRDYTHALGPLMGESVTNRSLMVRGGTDAERDIRQAIEGLPQDIRLAWSEVMVQGLQRNGAEHFVALVVNRAIDLNHPENAESSLLHQLAREGSNCPGSTFGLEERFSLLRDAGADLDLACGGTTPLHAAAGADNLATVDGLLAAGANPNLRDTNGRTALSIAQARAAQDPEQANQADAARIVTRLLEGGADPAQENQPAAAHNPRQGAQYDSVRTGDILLRLGASAGLVGLGNLVVAGLVGTASLTRKSGEPVLSDFKKQRLQNFDAADKKLTEYIDNLTGTTLGPERKPQNLYEAEARLRACARQNMNDTLADLFPGEAPGEFTGPPDEAIGHAANQTIGKTPSPKGSLSGSNSSNALIDPTVPGYDLNSTLIDLNATIDKPVDLLPTPINLEHPCMDEFQDYRHKLNQLNNAVQSYKYIALDTSNNTKTADAKVLTGALAISGSFLGLSAIHALWLYKRAQAR